MKSLGTAFANIRHNVPQTDETLESLRNFVDFFVTVSTHGPTVGEDVAKIAREVNMHNHTKTCTKNGRTKCRFNYPKPPSPYTIIQKPIDKTDKEQKEMFKKATATWTASILLLRRSSFHCLFNLVATSKLSFHSLIAWVLARPLLLAPDPNAANAASHHAIHFPTSPGVGRVLRVAKP